MSEEPKRPKYKPAMRRAMARRHVAWCNTAVHDAPWIDVDRTTQRGIFVALDERTFDAHDLAYEQGISKIGKYDPQRFTGFYDSTADFKDCIKVHDNKTGRIVVWPYAHI